MMLSMFGFHLVLKWLGLFLFHFAAKVRMLYLLEYLRKKLSYGNIILLCFFITGCGTSDFESQIDSIGGKRFVLASNIEEANRNESRKEIIRILNRRLEERGNFKKQIYLDSSNIIIDVINDSQKTNIREDIKFSCSKGLFTIEEVDADKVDKNGNFLPTGKVLIDNASITKADVLEVEGNFNLMLRLNDKASETISESTKRLIGKNFGIFLDGILIHSVSVQEEITGDTIVITSIKNNRRDALSLVTLIRYGPWPFELDIKDSKEL